MLSGLQIAEVKELLRARVWPQRAGLEGLPFPSLSIDSRTLRPGMAFLALRGERYDGHDFIPEALQKGARVVVHGPSWRPDRLSSPPEGRLFLEVPEPLAALHILAHYRRRKWGGPLLAITGSMGKTTTKTFTASLLEPLFRVHRSRGNLNNHIGVPLSLLELREDHQISVLELAMNHAGEIRQLARLCSPTAALLTNVAPVHLAFFRSLDEIAAAKGEVLEFLAPDGLLFYNADDARLAALAATFPGERIPFGWAPGAAVRVREFAILNLQRMRFVMEAWGRTLRGEFPCAGRHFLSNLCGAVAVALRLGVPLEEVAARLTSLKPLAGRGGIHRLGGVTLWDDSYNSNPEAVREVLFTLRQVPGFRRKLAALGDMLELGERSAGYHREVGKLAAQAGLDWLLTVGREAEEILAGARSAGFPARRSAHFPDPREAAGCLRELLREGDLLLIKGSRGIAMDQILDELRGEKGRSK